MTPTGRDGLWYPSVRACLLTLLVLLCASPARAECEVTGVASLDRLRVRVQGHRLRTLSVNSLPVAVRPGRGTRYRDVRVLAPVAFGARTDADIPWAVPRPTAVAEGLLWWLPGVEIEQVRERVERDELVVRAQVDVGVWVDRLHVPCEEVRVGLGEGSADAPSWGARTGPSWAPVNGHVWLASRPDDDSAATIRVEAPDGLRTPFVEIERRDGWVRVVARFESGAMVRGWARPHHLRPSTESPEDRRPYRRAIPAVHAANCRRGAPDRDEYVGPAHISVGTFVRFGRGGDTWATVSEPALFTVSWHHGSRWVRVVHVPGLRGDGRCPEVITHAWVDRRAVSLSGEGSGGAALLDLMGVE